MPILRDKTNSPEPIENQVRDKGVKVYWWRWVVLFVSVANLSITNALWITFSPIADVIACYYSVSNFWVNSLSMVSMLTYMLFIIPSVWLLNRIGLRATAVIGAFLNAAGACLRLAGVGKHSLSPQTQQKKEKYCTAMIMIKYGIYISFTVVYVQTLTVAVQPYESMRVYI